MSTFVNTDPTAFKGVWVFCEQREGKLMPTDFELISKGRDLANELGVNLCGLLLGGEGIESAAKELGGYGADKVIVCESPLLATYTTDGYATAKKIDEETGRGATLIKAIGTYSGIERHLILCACGKAEIFKVRNAAHAVDPNAFVMITEASEVFGEGFTPPELDQ